MVVMAQMAKVDILVTLRSIKDLTCLAIWPWTEEAEGLLEEMMPTEDIPDRDTVARLVGDIKELTYDQKDMLVEFFDDLKVVHN